MCFLIAYVRRVMLKVDGLVQSESTFLDSMFDQLETKF